MQAGGDRVRHERRVFGPSDAESCSSYVPGAKPWNAM
jgi:hypothetical protein